MWDVPKLLAPVALSAALLITGCSATADPDPSTAPSTAGPSTSAPSGPASSGAAATTITFETDRGAIHVATDPAAPQTVASMTQLAESGYFDDTICHRLVTSGIYVLQCGDPTGTGSGGPGYVVPDENLPAAEQGNYPAGTVAMANSGPNTAGSQFFIVYEDTTLPPGYTVWGQVTKGLDVVKAIAAQGTATGAGDGPPKKPVTIKSTTTD